MEADMPGNGTDWVVTVHETVVPLACTNHVNESSLALIWTFATLPSVVVTVVPGPNMPSNCKVVNIS